MMVRRTLSHPMIGLIRSCARVRPAQLRRAAVAAGVLMMAGIPMAAAQTVDHFNATKRDLYAFSELRATEVSRLLKEMKELQSDLAQVNQNTADINLVKAEQRAKLEELRHAWIEKITAMEKAGVKPEQIGDATKDLAAAIEQKKLDIDSMTELGEIESLRIQMAMDRMAKMMSTVSNLLKKISETASQITQNLKGSDRGEAEARQDQSAAAAAPNDSANAAAGDAANAPLREVLGILAKEMEALSENVKKINDSAFVGTQTADVLVQKSFEDLKRSVAGEEGRLDAIGDLTQLMQMRLQKYLDAYSKMFEMLSNALKKMSGAADNMAANLKGGQEKSGAALSRFAELQREVQSWDFSDGDIEALIWIVMMEASRDSADVMRDQLKEMRDALNRKKELREAMATVQSVLDAAKAKAQQRYDAALRKIEEEKQARDENSAWAPFSIFLGPVIGTQIGKAIGGAEADRSAQEKKRAAIVALPCGTPRNPCNPALSAAKTNALKTIGGDGKPSDALRGGADLKKTTVNTAAPCNAGVRIATGPCAGAATPRIIGGGLLENDQAFAPRGGPAPTGSPGAAPAGHSPSYIR